MAQGKMRIISTSILKCKGKRSMITFAMIRLTPAANGLMGNFLLFAQVSHCFTRRRDKFGADGSKLGKLCFLLRGQKLLSTNFGCTAEDLQPAKDGFMASCCLTLRLSAEKDTVEEKAKHAKCCILASSILTIFQPGGDCASCIIAFSRWCQAFKLHAPQLLTWAGHTESTALQTCCNAPLSIGACFHRSLHAVCR